MVLYIDETGNDEYFIVAGLLVKSDADVEIAYKRFKNKVRGFKITPKYKSRIFTEFKSSWLDNDQQRIKIKMLEEISSLDGAVIYSCYLKRSSNFNQVLKESVYITLLSTILSSLKEETSVIFDGFNKRDFEENIIRSTESIDIVKGIRAGDSQEEHGLQFIDNVCSVLRRNKSNDDPWNFYKIIEHVVTEV